MVASSPSFTFGPWSLASSTLSSLLWEPSPLLLVYAAALWSMRAVTQLRSVAFHDYPLCGLYKNTMEMNVALGLSFLNIFVHRGRFYRLVVAWLSGFYRTMTTLCVVQMEMDVALDLSALNILIHCAWFHRLVVAQPRFSAARALWIFALSGGCLVARSGAFWHGYGLLPHHDYLLRSLYKSTPEMAVALGLSFLNVLIHYDWFYRWMVVLPRVSAAMALWGFGSFWQLSGGTFRCLLASPAV